MNVFGPSGRAFAKHLAAIPAGERFRAFMEDDDPAQRSIFVFVDGRMVSLGLLGVGAVETYLSAYGNAGRNILHLWNRWRWEADLFSTFVALGGRFESCIMPNPRWVEAWGFDDLDHEEGAAGCS